MTDEEASRYCSTVQATIHDLIDGMPDIVRILAAVSAFSSLNPSERIAAMGIMRIMHERKATKAA